MVVAYFYFVTLPAGSRSRAAAPGVSSKSLRSMEKPMLVAAEGGQSLGSLSIVVCPGLRGITSPVSGRPSPLTRILLVPRQERCFRRTAVLPPPRRSAHGMERPSGIRRPPRARSSVSADAAGENDKHSGADSSRELHRRPRSSRSDVPLYARRSLPASGAGTTLSAASSRDARPVAYRIYSCRSMPCLA